MAGTGVPDDARFEPEHEEIELTVKPVPLDEAVRRARTAGELTNAAAAAALLAAALCRNGRAGPAARGRAVAGPAGTLTMTTAIIASRGPRGGRLAPAAAVRGFLDHLAVERGVAPTP